MDVEIEGQKFVSSRTISLEREQVRDARDTVLKVAERKYQARVEREEQKVARGDHKWMLPDLEKDLESKKKKKKHKKEKKKKDKKRDSGSDDDWVESDKNKIDAKKLERDSFMEFGFLATYSKNDLKAKANAEKKPEVDAKAALGASRELNPIVKAQLSAQAGALPHAKTISAKPSHGGQSGDGGLTWLIRAFKRAEDQAREGDQSLEEIAEKRWGSVGTFLDMVSKARDKASYIDRKLQGELNRLEKEYDISAEPSKHVKKDNKDRERSDRPSFRQVRSRSRSNEKRQRSRSRDRRDRSKSRGRHNRSRSRDKRDRSGSRDRYNRSRSRERRNRSRSRDRSDRTAGKFAKPGEKMSKSIACNQREGGGSWKSMGRREIEQEEGRKRNKEREEQKKQASDSSSESEKETEVTEEKPAAAVAVLTEAELNTLASKVMKAELMGNDELAAELKVKLEDARVARADMAAKGINPDQEPEVVTRIKGENMKQKRKKTKVETHKDGERVRYFGDDDKYNLKQMFEREKMDTAEDQHGLLSRLAGRTEKTNDDFDMDDMIVSTAAGKQSEELEDIKRKNKAVSNQLAMEKTLQDCKWCIGSKRSLKHLMVSMGKSVYLALPGTTSMAQGHCLIVPMGHCMAATEMDEDVWNEVQDYRKALVRMFQSQGEDCVFFETAMGFKKHPHMVIECIPLPEDMGSMLPMYYQKAIQECETEWSNNKKLVKLKEKNIARNIPRGLPYFHVDFGMDMGFAHVIEDEEDWNRRFGHEVVGGMMDTEPRTMRNPPWEQFDEQKRKVIQFGGMWAQFDWTKSLKQTKSGDITDSDSD
eukprot:GFUD01036233.1.p1 GENE.GFUD01036233.1~~GFUD01036233.1.p1  ORF type:complete len:820 (+),score=317.06 GFUD01036233.1:41-2500(+)